jgi:hypothetical protein
MSNNYNLKILIDFFSNYSKCQLVFLVLILK